MKLKAAILKALSKRTYSGEFRPGSFRNILIVRPAKIGDTICMFPLIRELKKSLPDASIDVYASTYNNFMFKYAKQVRRVYTKHKERNVFGTVLDLIKMRHNHYDLVIDTIDIRFGKVLALLFIKPDWLIANVGFERRYGLDNSDLGLYYKLTTWKPIHTADRLLEFLQLLGIQNYDSTLEFPIGIESVSFAESFLRPYRDNHLIGLNADASDQARSILDEELVDICTGIRNQDSRLRILLFATPDRREHMRSLIEQSKLDNVILEDHTENIFDVAALVSFLKVMISPDTSFVHIASAFNIPTVAIFQNDANHINYWSPRSNRYRIVKPVEVGSTIRGFSTAETASAAIDLLAN